MDETRSLPPALSLLHSQSLGVIGALLLFADYTVTASLSAVDAFHYFGLGSSETHIVAERDPGAYVELPEENKSEVSAPHERLWQWRSPGLWAIIAIVI